ncbi:MAG: hypothetical protein BHK79_07120 [Halanaerobium sp. MDAL1]|nr:MAG: hypothetical protein BHK79_07120 [Halanaerobium sp. MDAL1]
METINFRDLFMELKNVEYKNIGISRDIIDSIENDKEFSIEMKMEDNYKIQELNKNHVTLEYKRKKYFIPESFYEIEIIITVDYDLECEDPDIDEVKKEIEQNKKQLLLPVTTQASLLIAQLTNVDTNKIPDFDPPFYKG